MQLPPVERLDHCLGIFIDTDAPVTYTTGITSCITHCLRILIVRGLVF